MNTENWILPGWLSALRVRRQKAGVRNRTLLTRPFIEQEVFRIPAEFLPPGLGLRLYCSGTVLINGSVFVHACYLAGENDCRNSLGIFYVLDRITG